MADACVDNADTDWDGIAGDRRLGLRSSHDRSGFPWDEGPRVHVTMRDERYSMINYDPDSARATPDILNRVVRVHDNTAGVYGTVVRTGRICGGQLVHLEAR
jgi:hypothetical protein